MFDSKRRWVIVKPGGNVFTIDKTFSQLTNFFQSFKPDDFTGTAERNGTTRNGEVGFIEKMGLNE